MAHRPNTLFNLLSLKVDLPEVRNLRLHVRVRLEVRLVTRRRLGRRAVFGLAVRNRRRIRRSLMLLKALVFLVLLVLLRIGTSLKLSVALLHLGTFPLGLDMGSEVLR